ncbi:GNAT family N-acetyltransferase [Galbibacter sp. EGI 63066]|uniref:GNAT family N-acetyltransferase n=1 Tax=Galbibacter sp. EGI 63066 TaxID=2993559 RepID=UPI002248D1A1|nr:GNAT family N-acetyltransferase [Galbibacter sp. EGI 63066]MCX2680230.1 GNAT family N-acetyltransferase [Galbibacter sp. EGI 63066]
MIFGTSRLTIRKLNMEDLKLFHKMQNDQTVMKYISGKAFSYEENKRDLQNILNFYKNPKNDFWVWAVTLAETSDFIGTVALVKNEKEEYEIGYRLLKEYWKKGYGKEVTNGLIKYAFEVKKIKEVVAYVDKNNVTSVRILDSTFNLIKEFYNEQDNCIDRYYKLSN